MLSDNWPCVIPYMKENKIYHYFDKIYVSSIYGVEKKDKVFFDYPLKDFNIKPGEALFIDDNELNNLKLLCDLVFGEGNYINTISIIWWYIRLLIFKM